MRDVNVQISAVIINNSVKFYLNYEGCKLVANAGDPLNPQQFYLNYEGCKLADYETGKTIPPEFYLNYEGCKHEG